MTFTAAHNSSNKLICCIGWLLLLTGCAGLPPSESVESAKPLPESLQAFIRHVAAVPGQELEASMAMLQGPLRLAPDAHILTAAHLMSADDIVLPDGTRVHDIRVTFTKAGGLLTPDASELVSIRMKFASPECWSVRETAHELNLTWWADVHGTDRDYIQYGRHTGLREFAVGAYRQNQCVNGLWTSRARELRSSRHPADKSFVEKQP